MKRLALLALGSVFAIGLVACSNVSMSTTANDADAQAFMDSVIPSIFNHWDASALEAAADKSVYNGERMIRAREKFANFSAVLGTMQAYSKATGTTQIVKTPAGEVKHASYAADLTYTKGKAIVTVDATKNSGKWQIEAITVQPIPNKVVPTPRPTKTPKKKPHH